MECCWHRLSKQVIFLAKFILFKQNKINMIKKGILLVLVCLDLKVLFSRIIWPGHNNDGIDLSFGTVTCMVTMIMMVVRKGNSTFLVVSTF